MSYQDKSLVCVGCGKDFDFTASEQAFFDSKGFTSEPKRCKPCRQARRRKKPRGRSEGEYRSPAFHDSAPKPQRGRRPSGRGGPGRRSGPSEYRSPAFRDVASGEGVYRSPAFQKQPTADSEYRSIAFPDHELDEVRNEYRAPGFQDRKKEHRDEQPLFSMICSACGEKAMVPFLPEEVEDPVCPDCHRKQREQAAAEKAAARKAAAEKAAAEKAAAEKAAAEQAADEDAAAQDADVEEAAAEGADAESTDADTPDADLIEPDEPER